MLPLLQYSANGIIRRISPNTPSCIETGYIQGNFMLECFFNAVDSILGVQSMVACLGVRCMHLRFLGGRPLPSEVLETISSYKYLFFKASISGAAYVAQFSMYILYQLANPQKPFKVLAVKMVLLSHSFNA